MPDEQRLDLVLRRVVRQVGRWDSVSWVVDQVRMAEPAAAHGARRVDDGRIEACGLRLRLHRDQAEDYCQNLASSSPYLFIVCSKGIDDDGLYPRVVTTSQAEAADYMDTDDEVLSCPLPQDLLDWLVAWVGLVTLPEPRRKKRSCADD